LVSDKITNLFSIKLQKILVPFILSFLPERFRIFLAGDFIALNKGNPSFVVWLKNKDLQ